MGEWQSVVAITEQVLEQMDPKAVKALWLRGRSFQKLEEWDRSIECLQRAIKCEPANAEFRKALEEVK